MKCPACGWNNLASPSHCFNCHAALTQAPPPADPPAAPAVPVLAGFGRRLGAALVDGVLMAAGAAAALWLMFGTGAWEHGQTAFRLGLWLLPLALLLPAVLDAWTPGSVGRRLMGIRVVTGRGTRPGLLRSLVRHVFKYGAHFGLPLVLKLLEHWLLRPRLLHDAVARTHVVHADAELAQVQHAVAGQTRGNLLGLVLAAGAGTVLAAVGLLALLFWPSTQPADPQRSAVRAVWTASRPLVLKLQRHHERTGAFPATPAEAGFETPAGWQDLRFDARSGRIVITAGAPIAGVRIVMLPVWRTVKGETRMSWRCGSPDLPAASLPSICRDEVAVSDNPAP